MQSIISPEQWTQLIENGAPQNTSKDHKPVLRLYTQYPQMEWLLTSINPKKPHFAYGVSDLGFNYPQIGFIDLQEIEANIKNGWNIGLDTSFKPSRTTKEYYAHYLAVSIFREELEILAWETEAKRYEGDLSYLAYRL